MKHVESMEERLWNDTFIDQLTGKVKDVFDLGRLSVSSELKAQRDYVTNVDRALEDTIIDYIQAALPEHQVFGEETLPTTIDFSKPTWIVDPLDGTSNFLFDVPFYGCSIAYIEEREVTMGLVLDLVNNEIFKAFRKRGAFLNGVKLDVTNVSSDFVGVSSGFIEQSIKQQPALIPYLLGNYKFRLLGSQALHLCYVAAGRFKACINYEAKIWDDIAAALVLEEAGGRYRTHSGFSPSRVDISEISGNVFSVGESSEEQNFFEKTSVIGMDESG